MRSLLTILLLFLHWTAHAFSLLGPYSEWMTPTIGYRQPSDIGGPVNLGQEYRWNLPVLTYGFDEEFGEYFGPEGVAAVERAIIILNRLPEASNIRLGDYPHESKSVNLAARDSNLIDLKSATLGLLLEQMGLAQPTRYVWALRTRETRTVGGISITNYIVLVRNFSPTTLQPTNRVNSVFYNYSIVESGDPTVADVVEVSVEPQTSRATALADLSLEAGEFLTGLTRDDAGGLRYLLRQSTINVERLPQQVTALAGSSYVNRARRPGVEKITFLRLKRNYEGGWQAITNLFMDTYLRNGKRVRQSVRRVIRRPDILFSAATLTTTNQFPTNTVPLWSSCGVPLLVRTSTARWINNHHLNPADNDPAGPGVIPPGAVITFNKLSPESATCVLWGSFGSSPRPPIILGADMRQ